MTGDEFVSGYVTPLAVYGGAALTVAAIVSAVHSVRLLAYGASAEGVVVRIEQEHMLDTWRWPSRIRWVYWPVVAFTTPDGQRVEVRSNVAGPHGGPALGSPVQVCYPPGRPDVARIRTFSALWGPALALGFMGVGFLGFGLMLVALA